MNWFQGLHLHKMCVDLLVLAVGSQAQRHIQVTMDGTPCSLSTKAILWDAVGSASERSL